MKLNKKRGRPINSGINADLELMPKIADAIVRNGITTTEAIRTIHPKATDESILRRFQRKFRNNKEKYLSEAKARHEAEKQDMRSRVVVDRRNIDQISNHPLHMGFPDSLRRTLAMAESVSHTLRVPSAVQDLVNFHRQQKQIEGLLRTASIVEDIRNRFDSITKVTDSINATLGRSPRSYY